MPFADAATLDAALGPDVAAVIVEPVQGVAGARVVGAGFLRRAREATARAGTVLIFDEVQCGMGRTGAPFAAQAYGVVPDILTTAKGLAGGFPAGAVLVADDLARSVGHGDLGTTFGGGPLACALVIAVLDALESPGFLANVRRLSARLEVDEIGDMPLSIQAKLLRALQERQFYPIGSEKPIEVDVRVIVATQKDLEGQVKQGLFREDLFYRIHVIPVHLPPLRERKEDIPLLVEHFLKKFSVQIKKEVKGLTPQAIQKLMLHEWPGNVRELENAVEYAGRYDSARHHHRRSYSTDEWDPISKTIKTLKRGERCLREGLSYTPPRNLRR